MKTLLTAVGAMVLACASAARAAEQQPVPELTIGEIIGFLQQHAR